MAGKPKGKPKGKHNGRHKGRHRKRLFGDKGSLPGLASRAIGWSFASNAIARLGTLPIGIVLARLLGPHAFGTFAVALVALVALLSFNDLSVSLAIVRWEGDPDEIAPTVATLSVLASLIIYAACYFMAPSFSWAMGAPQATEVVRVLALNVLVDGLAAAPAAMLQRQFRQDRKMIADQVNNWLGAAVSIALAWQGFGPMSLAIGRICGGGASVVLFFMFAPVRFGFDRRQARALLKFGLPLAGSSIVVFAVVNTDQLVVGHLLGATALGFYALALNLAGWPVTMFSLPTRSVAPAVFSRVQQDKAAMRTGFLCVARLLSAISVPICLVLGGAAIPLVGLVYGTRWVPAAAALAGLGVLSALRIGFELIYDFFVVLARSRVVLLVQLVWIVGLVPGLIAGTIADGIGGAAIAEASVAGFLVLPCYLFWLAKVGIRPTDLARRLWLPTLVGVAVAAVAAVASRTMHTNLDALEIAAVGTLAGIGLLATRMRPTLAELRQTLRPDQVLPAAAPAPAPAPEQEQEQGQGQGPAQHRPATPTPITAGSQS